MRKLSIWLFILDAKVTFEHREQTYTCSNGRYPAYTSITICATR